MPTPFDPFGTDLLVTDQGDLVVWPTGGLGVVSGSANAVQALGLRMRTPLGDLPQHATYGSGFHGIIGGKASRQGVTGQAFAEIRRLLAQDDRFLYAEGTSINERQEAGGAAYDVACTLYLVGGEAMLVSSLSDASVDAVVETTNDDAQVAFTSGDDGFLAIGQDTDEDADLRDLSLADELGTDLAREATAEQGELQ